LVERLGFTARLEEISARQDDLSTTPGVVVLGSRSLTGDRSGDAADVVADLPPWVMPLVLVQPGSGLAPADVTRRLRNTIDNPVPTFDDVDALLETLPTIIARVRRTYLRRADVYPPPHDKSDRPPRLRDGMAEFPRRDGNE
jgi:hypothetical protein